MGYFAISKRYATVDFTIAACHLNLWILPRTWFRHAYYFDVGLRITAEKKLRRIRVAFPFDAETADIADLSPAVLKKETCELIFGRPVVVDDGRVKYSSNGLNVADPDINDRVVAISTVGSTPTPETKSDNNFSVWVIEFESDLQPDDTSYIRFRMRVRNPKRLWSHKGWGYAKRGFVADIRVSDVRESVLLGIGKSEVPDLVPIGSLFAFIVAPSQLVPQHFSPNIHYSRLLEPSAWADYLQGKLPPSVTGRIVFFFKSFWKGKGARPALAYQDRSKFSIHQWRSATAVSVNTPLRIYADFAREFGRELPFIYFGGAIGIAIVNWLMKWLLDWLFHGRLI